MQVKTGSGKLQRLDLYLDPTFHDDRELAEYFEPFKARRGVSGEIRRLLLAAIEAERSAGRSPVRRPVGLAPRVESDVQPLALPSGSRVKRLPAPPVDLDDRESTAEELANATGNFLGAFG